MRGLLQDYRGGVDLIVYTIADKLPFGKNTASFVPVIAMNPNDQRQFVIAVAGDAVLAKTIIAFTANRGDSKIFAFRFGPQQFYSGLYLVG